VKDTVNAPTNNKTKQNETKSTTNNNMSLVCEISGEPLLGSNENEVVVTPSGHICIKRLLLTKLVENGGVDPFETTRQLPLSEDQLVTLQTGGSNSTGIAAPPRPQATSLPNMLGLIQKEYDALVLELFDTRKALEETRRELSQALYQNDAAIRVVARVAQERDTVKQQLEQWNASANAPTSTTDAAATTATAAAAKPAAEPAASTGGGEERPSAKRRRILEPTAVALENDLPDEDLKAMSEVWAQLNKVRKPTLKAAAAEALSPKTLGDCAFLETKAWHKSTNRGISSISSTHDGASYLTVTAGKDKQLVVYNEVDQVVQHTFNFGLVATCVDIGKSLVVAGSVKGTITAFSVGGEGGSSKENTINVGSKVVDVSVHPTGQHVCAATVDGRVIVACWIAEEQRLQQIATFQATKEGEKEGYTSAALHPDGLIYVAGTKTGKLHVWDFKNKVLAATLQVSLINQQLQQYILSRIQPRADVNLKFIYRESNEWTTGRCCTFVPSSADQTKSEHHQSVILFLARVSHILRFRCNLAISVFFPFLLCFILTRREKRGMPRPPLRFPTTGITSRPDTIRPPCAFGI
jgi:pre-mRNA-processing factor 19